MSTKNNVSYLLANKCRDYCRVKRLHHIYKYGINSSSRILLRAPYAPLGKFERKQWKDSKGNLHTGLIFVRKKLRMINNLEVVTKVFKCFAVVSPYFLRLSFRSIHAWFHCVHIYQK